MKLRLVEASKNSLATLDQDFERNTKGVMREQDAAMTEDQLMKSAMEQSLKEYKTPATGYSAGPNALKLVLQLKQLGFTSDQATRAIKACPPPHSIDQLLNYLYSL